MSKGMPFTGKEITLCVYAVLYNASDFGGVGVICWLESRSKSSIELKIRNLAALCDEIGIKRNPDIRPLSGKPPGESGRQTNREEMESLSHISKGEHLKECLSILENVSERVSKTQQITCEKVQKKRTEGNKMLDEYYDFRNAIVESLKKDIVGPRSDTEELRDPPSLTYSSGILFPRSQAEQDEDRDEFVATEKEDEDDPPVALANVNLPSSLGISFAVDQNSTKEIIIEIKAAKYEKPIGGDSEDSSEPRWKRIPLEIDLVSLDLSVPGAKRIQTSEPGLELFARIRRPNQSAAVSVTLVLMNINSSGRQLSEREQKCFFQTSFNVTGPDSNSCFVERPTPISARQDKDSRSSALLFRHAREFATGHGCAVDWESDLSNPYRAISIWTENIPIYRLKLAESNPDIDDSKITMLGLANSEREVAARDLREICSAYRNWISKLYAAIEADSTLAVHKESAVEHLETCSEAADRIEAGIDLLLNNEKAWNAFKMMNVAMLKQRSRIVWKASGRSTRLPVEDDTHRWRPFQIAFILTCIKGIAEPEADNSGRDLLDLLWFPTGGGKTEAYLGLIAFTIFHRRLTNRDGGGVTALMRYTLRLLTLQQFERAAILICACEEMRRKSRELGTEAVSIGMWVGSDATPLNLDKAREVLNRLRAGEAVDKGNPVQLSSCPWCGTDLDYRNYWIRDNPRKLVISCNEATCEFGKGLPIYLIDEDVYNFRPTFLIATVDKFASLTWKSDCAALFNLDSKSPPPELIIQDELHLISGPLGTLTGLYETAVDAAATVDGIRPKVIASTATIRRAEDQIRKVFGREMRQFPPPGVDSRDSFFAVEADSTVKGDRMYVGVMAPSKSHSTLMIRTYAALLDSVGSIDPARDEVRDHYWTLVGYFMSLRVLGSARMQVQDDVRDRLSLLAGEGNHVEREIDPDATLVELTSRESATRIPEHLQRLTEPIPNAIDVLLATNMISVGVDVDRLGLMAVMGQPQSTAEYIQSTSRVGRKYPGLVVTMFNAARTRDRSHYESFIGYHSALYRQVEATSVTPFSGRARDRALHAVIVALARLLVPSLRENASAVNLKDSELPTSIKEIIEQRVKVIEPDELESTMSQIDMIEREWRDRAQQVPKLSYYHYMDEGNALLKNATELNIEDVFSTLWSMRNVDRESKLFLI